MDPRRFCCLTFLLTLPLAAQGLIPGQPPVAPVNPPAAAPAATPEEQLASLQREKERLQREIEYVRSRVSNASDLLAGKFANRTLSVRAIDAGRSAAAQPVAPALAPRHARLMQEDEINGHPADVMLLVNGTPISRGLFDQLANFQNPSIDAAMRGQMALYELIRIEGTATEFAEGAEASLSEVAAKLAEGKTVAELAPVFGTLPGAAEDGRIEITRNSRFGLRLEQIAFDLEDGMTSRPFHHHTGYVVLHRDSLEKGASSELDKVIAHALLIPYTTDAASLQKAQMAVSTAQVDIVVRDKETMMLLPVVFRDAEFQPKPPAPTKEQLDTMKQTLNTLTEEMEKARASGDENEKGRLPMLEERFKRLSAEIETLTARMAESDNEGSAEQDDVKTRKPRIPTKKAE